MISLADLAFYAAAVGLGAYLVALVSCVIRSRRLRARDPGLDRPVTARELHEHALEEAQQRDAVERKVRTGDEWAAAEISRLDARVESAEVVARDLHHMPDSTRLASAAKVIEAYRRCYARAFVAMELAKTEAARSRAALLETARALDPVALASIEDPDRDVPARVVDLRRERDGLTLGRDLAARKAEVQAACLDAVRAELNGLCEVAEGLETPTDFVVMRVSALATAADVIQAVRVVRLWCADAVERLARAEDELDRAHEALGTEVEGHQATHDLLAEAVTALSQDSTTRSRALKQIEAALDAAEGES